MSMRRRERTLKDLAKHEVPRSPVARGFNRSYYRGSINPTRVAVRQPDGTWTEILTLDPNPSKLHGPVLRYREIIPHPPRPQPERRAALNPAASPHTSTPPVSAKGRTPPS